MFVFSGQSGAKITNNLFQFHFKSKWYLMYMISCWTVIYQLLSTAGLESRLTTFYDVLHLLQPDVTEILWWYSNFEFKFNHDDVDISIRNRFPMIATCTFLEEPPTVLYPMIFIGSTKFLYWFKLISLHFPVNVFSFDLCTQTWSLITPSLDSVVPSGRLFHAAAVVGDGM